MLINLSNHPVSGWQLEQRETAEKLYGEVVDIPFPRISTLASVEEVFQLAQIYADKAMQILATSPKSKNAVHIMGEFTFTYNFVLLMNKYGVDTIVSTSERMVYYDKNGNKNSAFKFVKFRSYNINNNSMRKTK